MFVFIAFPVWIPKPVKFSVLSACLPSAVSFRWAGFPGTGFGKFQSLPEYSFHKTPIQITQHEQRDLFVAVNRFFAVVSILGVNFDETIIR